MKDRIRRSAAKGDRRYTLWILALISAAVLPVWAGDPPEARPEDTPEATAEAPSDAPSVSESETKAVKGAVISLHGDITDVTAESLERRLEEARAAGAEVIVLDLDTPGGYVTSSIAIADLFRGLTGVKTVAWVNPNAYSGGSLVAVACDEIVMSRSSRIGDSQVIMGGPGGAQAVPEELKPKANTPVLHDFRMSAKKNGYSLVLSEAFVIPEREVWWLENVKTGEREFVFREEKIKRLGDDEKATAIDWESPETPAEGVPEANDWKLVESYYDALLETDLPTNQPIVPDSELLQMSPGEAIAYGFCKAVVADESELRSRYNLASLVRLDANWSETLAHWLTSMTVRGFLLVVIFLAGYVEFHTPGVGVAGLVALIALAVFIGAPYLTGLANFWEIVLILVGVLLIMLEVLVIPGFGVAGIGGVLCILMGLVATFIPDEPGRSLPSLFPLLPATLSGLKTALVTLVGAMFASLIGTMMLSRYLPRVALFRNIVPANPMPSEVAVPDPYRGGARVGDVGVSEGPLHPAGKARFGSILVDVVTQGEFLDTAATVEVVERRGNRVVVRAVK